MKDKGFALFKISQGIIPPTIEGMWLQFPCDVDVTYDQVTLTMDYYDLEALQAAKEKSLGHALIEAKVRDFDDVFILSAMQSVEGLSDQQKDDVRHLLSTLLATAKRLHEYGVDVTIGLVGSGRPDNGYGLPDMSIRGGR